jgi:signal transduction histidine kinase
VFVANAFFGTVSIFRDITKEVEVENLKSEFVSTVSHELRTPMTSIKGYADLMLMGAAGELSDPQNRYLQVIKSNADRLHELVNDLLDISRIETGRTKLDLRPLDIAQIVNQVISEHVQGLIQAKEKHLQVTADMKAALPLVNGDQTAVIQILTNLLDNALNYTLADGEIQIKAEARDNYVYISVKDSGIGITEENQAKIFDRFFRAEDQIVQQVRGTGLGLAIVRALVEMHGGELTVESTPNVGSTFTFNLPIVVEDGD